MDDQNLNSQPVQKADVTEEVADQPSSEQLTRSDQKIVAAICLFLLVWAGGRWIDLSHWGREEIEIHRIDSVETTYLVDVNTSNWLEFSMLEGIGEVLAKRIVDYRDEHGDFATVQELQDVKGIGKKTFARILPHLVLREPADQ
ncbi:MAG: helix-hairpin-helix domain-containing protein [Planctomycetaceae bacterium]|nr:helix-hairpin-helix domain-containing protein [Planctomycetaceae bacterium]